ncbi:MAG: tetratricopeptide repeat protein [Desulfarculus sp.]|nr:tetratricopeptide repeat protein [Desulfarculus sp.]
MKFTYRRMSLLLVDSTQMALDTMEGYLEPMGFHRIWTAKGAEEAMSQLRDRPVDLVITHWKLQPISGFQLVDMIRRDAKLREIPILLVADPKDKHIAAKAKEAGVNDLVKLPLDAKRLCAAVDKGLEHLVDADEEEFLAQMDAARVAVRMGDLDKAETAYRAALAVKTTEDAQMGLGKVLRQKGDLKAAEEVFVGALKANPLSLRAFLGLASVYQSSGRLEDALKVLAAAVSAAKRVKESGEVTSVLFFYMGELELQLKRLKEALGFFEQAMAESNQDKELPVKVGDALVAEGHLEESERFYERALELDPELAHVYNRLGIAYRRQKKFDMAITLYQKAQQFRPKDEHLLYNMARCYWEMEQYQRAAEILTQALEHQPEFVEAAKLLDACLHRQGFKVAEGAPPEPPPE